MGNACEWCSKRGARATATQRGNREVRQGPERGGHQAGIRTCRALALIEVSEPSPIHRLAALEGETDLFVETLDQIFSFALVAAELLQQYGCKPGFGERDWVREAGRYSWRRECPL